MFFTTYDAFNNITNLQTERVTNFLFEHLEQYRDNKSAITKSIQYAAKERPGLGGKIFVVEQEDKIIGAVVVNRTGMEEYIPENILVYIAIHKDFRGKGLGKKLMQIAIEQCEGDIALHVEHNNPAKILYEKLGFKNPYLEMRLKK